MSSTQVSREKATEASGAAGVPLRLEVVVIPVTDIDRAKSFYGARGGGSTPTSAARTIAWCS